MPVPGRWPPKSLWFKLKQQSYSRRRGGRGRRGFGKLLLPLSSCAFWEERQREQVQLLSSYLWVRTFPSQCCQCLTYLQLYILHSLPPKPWRRPGRTAVLLQRLPLQAPCSGWCCWNMLPQQCLIIEYFFSGSSEKSIKEKWGCILHLVLRSQS